MSQWQVEFNKITKRNIVKIPQLNENKRELKYTLTQHTHKIKKKIIRFYLYNENRENERCKESCDQQFWLDCLW